ncbi:MAG: pirin family protein [Chloroflexaceae bacterium]|nr:pirin family protein [Chloroflexaceae bacterium]
MLAVRKAQERGHANYGWLNTYYTFSFANYYDRNFMGFRSLRVINEDRVAGGAGFDTHGHRDMEIITYILDGALEHQDSIGTGSVIRRGEVQRMSAGTGILHSEFNHSASEPVHLLQIWLMPQVRKLAPSYEQKQFFLDRTPGKLQLVAAPDGQNGALTVHQAVNLYAGILPAGDTLTHEIDRDRYGWLQVARGELMLNGVDLAAGDGVAIAEERELQIQATTEAEFLLFDLA